MPYDLNKIYELKQLCYWCNATGDINIPGFAITALPSIDLLPAPAKELYTKFWSETSCASQYVVSFKDRFGLMLGWLFDYPWLREKGVLTDENEDTVIPKFHDAVFDTAEQLAEKHKDWPVLYGRDTDPDGDEILMFISADELAKETTKAWFDGKGLTDCCNELYDAVLLLMKHETEANAASKLVSENIGLRTQLKDARKKILPKWLYNKIRRKYEEDLTECEARMRDLAEVLYEYAPESVPFKNANQGYGIRREQKKQLEMILAELKKCDPDPAETEGAE